MELCRTLCILDLCISDCCPTVKAPVVRTVVTIDQPFVPDVNECGLRHSSISRTVSPIAAFILIGVESNTQSLEAVNSDCFISIKAFLAKSEKLLTGSLMHTNSEFLLNPNLYWKTISVNTKRKVDLKTLHAPISGNCVNLSVMNKLMNTHWSR